MDSSGQQHTDAPSPTPANAGDQGKDSTASPPCVVPSRDVVLYFLATVADTWEEVCRESPSLDVAAAQLLTRDVFERLTKLWTDPACPDELSLACDAARMAIVDACADVHDSRLALHSALEAALALINNPAPPL